MFNKKLVIKLFKFEENVASQCEKSEPKLQRCDKGAWVQGYSIKHSCEIKKETASYNNFNEDKNSNGISECKPIIVRDNLLSKNNNNQVKHQALEVGENVKILNSNEIKKEKPNQPHDDETEIWTYPPGQSIKCEEVHIKPEDEANLSKTQKKPRNISGHLPCTYCDAKYQIRQRLRDHIINVHLNPPNIRWYKCDRCTYKTKRRHYLKDHKLIHKNPLKRKLFPCDKCNTKCKRKCSLVQHKKEIHGEGFVKWLNCPQCESKFMRKTALRSHMIVHKNEKEITWYRCDYCSGRYKTKSSMAIHRTICPPPNDANFFCDKCDFKTLHRASLFTHKRTHQNPSERSMFTCMVCDKNYKQKTTLTRHMKVVHGKPGEAKTYKCPQCNFQSFYKNALTTHYTTHQSADEIPMFTCAKCSFQTKLKKILIYHIRLHVTPEELKFIKCSVANCYFKTDRPKAMMNHVRLHETNSRMLFTFCSVCSFKSRIAEKVEEHKKIHENHL